MDRSRTKLHHMLKNSTKYSVYFQPPENIRLKYPCVVYKMNSADTQFADNEPYIYEKKYNITVIDQNPDSEIPNTIAKFPRCIFDRFYTSDNLNHWSFNIYV